MQKSLAVNREKIRNKSCMSKVEFVAEFDCIVIRFFP